MSMAPPSSAPGIAAGAPQARLLPDKPNRVPANMHNGHNSQWRSATISRKLIHHKLVPFSKPYFELLVRLWPSQHLVSGKTRHPSGRSMAAGLWNVENPGRLAITIVTACLVFSILSLTAVGLRVWTRLVIRRFGVDDLFMCAGTVSYLPSKNLFADTGSTKLRI